MDINRADSPQENFDLDHLAAEAVQTAEPQKKSRREALWIAGIAGVIVLLGAAAYMGVRMGLLGNLSGQGSQPGEIPPGANGMGIKFNVTPAPELPTTPPDLIGIISRRDGGSLFVNQVMGTDAPVMESSGPVGGGAASGSSIKTPETGPEVEVVITKETKVYKDVTSFPEPSQMGQVEVHNLQQKLEPVDSLDDIKADASLRVWGEKRGDRVIAQVVLYSPPVIFTK